MKSILHAVLQKANAHPRDQNIQFFEEGHKYTIKTDPDSTYTSVTTWNHSHFPHFDADDIIRKMMKGKGWKEGHKYWGQTPEQIKELWDANKNRVSGAGTDMHYEIECFMNHPRLSANYTHQDLQKDYESEVPMYQTAEQVINLLNTNKNATIEDMYLILFHNNIVKHEELDVLKEWLRLVRE
jgi:hypothetical protein